MTADFLLSRDAGGWRMIAETWRGALWRQAFYDRYLWRLSALEQAAIARQCGFVVDDAPYRRAVGAHQEERRDG